MDKNNYLSLKLFKKYLIMTRRVTNFSNLLIIIYLQSFFNNELIN
jgi:hypothetical protein